jgi:hypothetical protein
MRREVLDQIFFKFFRKSFKSLFLVTHAQTVSELSGGLEGL